MPPFKPTPAQIAASAGARIPDVLAHGLDVVFCGINPGLYSGATGHHFARPGNRFWPALYRSGFTDRLLSPFEDATLPAYGLGMTKLVNRATATAAELTPEELIDGARRVARKIARYRPRWLAVLGFAAYRTAFADKTARLGEQSATIHGTRVWVLPNPSGVNAHYQLADLTRLFKDLRNAVNADSKRRAP